MTPHNIFRQLIAMLLLGLSLLVANTFATEKVLDASQIDKDPVSLTEYFAVLEDPGGGLTFQDVRSQDVASRFKLSQHPSDALSYGLTRSAVWLRWSVKNPTDSAIVRFVEIAYARLSFVDLYQPTLTGEYRTLRTGEATTYGTRPYGNRNFVFPITFPAHSEQIYYLRIQSETSLIVPARFWTPELFHANERRDYAGQMLYFGMATAMLVFNLLLFLVLRDSHYLLYVAFATSTILTLAGLSGLAHEVLWPHADWWANIAANVFGTLSTALIVLFLRSMLNTKLLVPKLDWLLIASAFGSLSLSVGFIISQSSVVKLATFFSLATFLLVLGVLILLVIKRQRSAYFFLIAFSFFLAGVIAFLLRAAEVLPHSWISSNGIQIGSAIEMLLLALALADRFNQIRRERARDQKALLKAQSETLNAQAEAIQAQSEKMTSLTQLVTNVAHEINTPIGAVKSSGDNISTALDEALTNLPKMFEILEPQPRSLFIQLVSNVKESKSHLTTREERMRRREAAKELENLGIDDSDKKAGILVKLGAHLGIAKYLPLLKHPEADFVLSTADSIGSIIRSTGNIHTAVDRVSKIVTTLRSFSQANSVGEMTNVDLKDGIEAVLAIYANHIKQNTEVIRLYEELPPLHCLPDELRQVWTHLIHNALQAMGYKGTLTIGLKQVGNEAVVSISDTGSGIPDEIRGRIFEPFFTTRPQGEGAGLGLDIVKKIVDKHKGRIDIQTQVGVGSTFSIYLPMTQAV